MKELFSNALNCSVLLGQLLSWLALSKTVHNFIANMNGRKEYDMRKNVIKRMWRHINKASHYFMVKYANKEEVLEFVKAACAMFVVAKSVAQQHNMSNEAEDIITSQLGGEKVRKEKHNENLTF